MIFTISEIHQSCEIAHVNNIWIKAHAITCHQSHCNEENRDNDYKYCIVTSYSLFSSINMIYHTHYKPQWEEQVRQKCTYITPDDSRKDETRRMAFSGMLRHVALVKTDVSEEFCAFFIRVTRIGKLGTTLAVTSNWCPLGFLRSMCHLLVTASVVPSSPILVTLMKEALSSCET
jgi:hypothetical protein